jgi:hypothetical protein
MAKKQYNVYKINTNTNTNTNTSVNNTNTTTTSIDTTKTNTNVIYNSEADLPEIVKTITFTAFLQGLEKNDFRAWTRHSTEDCPMIDENLIPALTKHMAELVKGLGRVLPRNPFKRGIQILDKDNGYIAANEHLLSVKIEVHFIETYGEITSERISYAVKEMNPNFKPDRHLIALQLNKADFPCPSKECDYYAGVNDPCFWTVYVKQGECRHHFNDTGKFDGNNPIYEDSGLLEFPEKSAWEYIEDTKKVVGNSIIIDLLRDMYKKEEIPQPKETTPVKQETKKFVAKGKKDQLGSIGDNVKIKQNSKKVSK